MAELVRLFDPISTLEPHQVVIEADQVWISPAGYFCIGWSWLDEDCSRLMGADRSRCHHPAHALRISGA